MLARSSVLAVAAALGLDAAAAAPARANGRFPEVIDVHFQEGNDDVIAAQATWGVILSRDDGATWEWICEEAVGFGGVYDPDYAFTPTGLLLASTIVEGLRGTRDFCSWEAMPAPLGPTGPEDEAEFVSQVEVAPDGTIYAAAPYDGGWIYRSTDDAVSFQAISQPDPATSWWESLAIARTPLAGGEHRLYLTGYELVAGGGYRHILLRSDDSGETWTPLPLDAFTIGAPGGELQLAAVSPTDPDLVFARVYQQNGMSVGDAIYRSDDAGASWTKVFEIGDDITGTVVRLNGDVVLATRLSEVFVSTDGGVTFGRPIASPTMNCLRERVGSGTPAIDGRLYACSRTTPLEQFALARSPTPSSWDVLFNHADVTAPVPCAVGTFQRDVCEDTRWGGTGGINCQYGLGDPDIVCVPLVDAAVPPDGPTVEPPPPDGCCSTSGGAAASGLLGALALGLACAPRRRRAPR